MTSTDDRPTIFALHALGSGAREFDPLRERLGDRAELVAIDLPGFGGRPAADGTTVEEMVDVVVREIRRRHPHRWVLLGHSMGGKVATLVARRALDGRAPVFGLAGVVLLAASPPSPEPMDESRRERMLAWTADGTGLDPDEIREFIDGNIGGALPAASDALARELLGRTSAEAWTAWLERGSREDHAAVAGVLDIPALLLAGGEDGDLGEAAQRAHNGPVYPRARVLVLDGAGHLLPLERPDEVADAIAAWWTEDAGRGPAIPPEWSRLYASARTPQRARAALARRLVADDTDYVPRALDVASLERLRVLADLLVPQPGVPIDLAARVDAQLASGSGDGWRVIGMPADTDAYRRGLSALGDLASLDPDARRERIRRAGAGEAAVGAGAELTAAQLAIWLEDARVDLARHWLAHPATMAAIGFDGSANGGDLPRIQGFQVLAADRGEGWEPTEGSVA